MHLKEFRKANKIKFKDIPLNRRTIADIESGKDTVSLKCLKVYLDAVGLKINYSLPE